MEGTLHVAQAPWGDQYEIEEKKADHERIRKMHGYAMVQYVLSLEDIEILGSNGACEERVCDYILHNVKDGDGFLQEGMGYISDYFVPNVAIKLLTDGILSARIKLFRRLRKSIATSWISPMTASKKFCRVNKV